MTVSDLTESALIARIQARLPPPPPWLTVGIGDDAAVVEPVRNRLDVLSVDSLVEGVHFDRRFTPAEAIGHRALAANLSDLAAMGAEPRLALLSLALPRDLPCDDFDGLADGLSALAARYRTHVVGGNLTKSPGPLVVDITVAGSVKRRQVLRRAGARPGDLVYVTGSVGAAGAGLEMLQRGNSARSGNPCIERYLFPEPRIRAGLMLSRNRAASACMDLSDGLADGLRQLAAASGIGAIVEERRLPLEPQAREWFEAAGDNPVTRAITAGDDYELVFTSHPRWAGRLKAAGRLAGSRLHKSASVPNHPRSF
jgi:thiamine-monophosphate kinase